MPPLSPLLLPPSKLRAALNQFKSWGALSWGSLVEHFLFAAPTTVGRAAHHRAAQSGLYALEEEFISQGWAGAETGFSKLAPDQAKPLTPSQFFGSHFDFAQRKPRRPLSGLYLPDGHDNGNIPFCAQSPEVQPSLFGGYAYALLEPPGGLIRPDFWWRKKRSPLPEETGPAFTRLCDALFGDLETLEIYQWPTDCSNHFNEDRKIWGNFFWTVHAPSKNWFVTILSDDLD